MRLAPSPAVLSLSVALATLAVFSPSAAAAARPRLAVLVIFDQLRAAEMDRYAPFFGPGGFGGLDGAHFDAVYAYAGTETGPGHATLATGTNPNIHGIATNHWFEDGKRRYVVEDAAFPVFGHEGEGTSARALAAPTLGDTMKADSGGRAKVVALSHKDRGSVLSGGPSADLAVWYDATLGRYTTSSAYGAKPPQWLVDKGKSVPGHQLSQAKWSPLTIPAAWKHLAPPDDREGEGAHEGLHRTFPHELGDKPAALQRQLYRLMPKSMDDLFLLSLLAVDQHGLGKDSDPDLLIVSVSTTDYVGHNFGPDSFEQLDTIRRADLALRKFLHGLTTRLGPESFAVVVTSDHGALPLPAPAQSQRWPHGIIVTGDLVDVAEAAAQAALSGGEKPTRKAPLKKKKRVLGFTAPQLFLDLADLPAASARKVLDRVALAIEGIDGIAKVYDFTSGDDDPFTHLMRASAFRGRAGQLFVRQKPRVIFMHKRDRLGTDHGTPYLYDRRVPLLVAGPGVRKGRYAQPVDPRDVAPTLAFLLGVPPPDLCEGKPVPAVGG